MGTPEQRFRPLANTLKRSELKGIRRECADAVGDVVRSARFQAFKSMARALGPYDQAIEAPCHDIAHMILDALPSSPTRRTLGTRVSSSESPRRWPRRERWHER